MARPPKPGYDLDASPGLAVTKSGPFLRAPRCQRAPRKQRRPAFPNRMPRRRGRQSKGDGHGDELAVGSLVVCRPLDLLDEWFCTVCSVLDREAAPCHPPAYARNDAWHRVHAVREQLLAADPLSGSAGRERAGLMSVIAVPSPIFRQDALARQSVLIGRTDSRQSSPHVCFLPELDRIGTHGGHQSLPCGRRSWQPDGSGAPTRAFATVG
jgi:hypothetical protein